MNFHRLLWTIPGFLAMVAAPAIAQPGPPPGSAGSLLGPTPGAASGEVTPTGTQGFIGGRTGASTPRVPFSIVRPPAAPRPEQETAPLPEVVPATELPLYGLLALPGEESPGPADGLTLDLAIGVLLRDNLDLKARALELPQADADILTASLRANPVLFADGQLIPYGTYTEQAPGGPVQYDLNITYPIDLSGKRLARIESATQSHRVVAAQYRDAARLAIDDLYTLYIDAVASREIVRFAGSSITGLSSALDKTETLYQQGSATKVDVNRIKLQLETARIALADSQVSERSARRSLGTILNMPQAASDQIQLNATLRSPAVRLPATTELVQIALQCRPDLHAFRLGTGLAAADLRLARANRFEDVFLLYQPFTYQDNFLQGRSLDPSTSWALGVTIPLPIYNRNQGNIRRAQVNITQTQTELASLERRIASQVELAEQEYHASRAALERIQADLLPAAREIIDDTYRLFLNAEATAIDYLNAQSEYNDVVRQYFTSLVRHRRSMLVLNTAMGRRLLP